MKLRMLIQLTETFETHSLSVFAGFAIVKKFFGQLIISLQRLGSVLLL